MRPLNDPYDRQEPQDSYERPRKLGSLAQKARAQKLNGIRVLLIILGLLIGGAHVFLLTQLDDNAAGFGIPAVAVPLARVLCLLFIGVGLLFVLFGIIVHTYPVAITIISLVIYASLTVLDLVSNPELVARALWLRILIIIGLVQGVRTAVVYERERAAEAAADDYE